MAYGDTRVSLKTLAGAIILTSVATGFVVTVSSQAPNNRQYINLREPRPTTVYSDAVVAGNLVFIAARIGTDPATGKVPDDPELEAKFVMDQIKSVVEKAGLTMDDIVNVQVFCPDPPTHSAKFNGVYRKYFGQNVPARAFTGSGPLLGGGRYQVQAVAMKR